MNTAQTKALERLRVLAEDQLPHGMGLREFKWTHVKDRWSDFVSVNVWYRRGTYGSLHTAHSFIGPRGGLTYPLWTEEGKQWEKRFGGDIMKVVRDRGPRMIDRTLVIRL